MPRMTIQSAVDAVILTVEWPTIRQLARVAALATAAAGAIPRPRCRPRQGA